MSKQSQSKRTRRGSRGAYLLPSLFTIGNMFLGFYAIVLGLRQQFEWSALVIFLAGILDGLDGRIARMTATESDFGREYDSLADLITFGMAPALLAYLWGLDELGRIGWLTSAFFMVSAATSSSPIQRSDPALGRPRLRRVCRHRRRQERWPRFSSSHLRTIGRTGSTALLVLILITLALLMVSSFRYPSFKRLELKKARSYRIVFPIAGVLIVAAYHPPAFFVSVAALYTAVGPFWTLRANGVKVRSPRPPRRAT